MKKFLIAMLALALASCAPVAAPPVVQPTLVPPTPIVVTVVVPVIQTQIVPASPMPVINTPAPAATLEVPTLAPASAPTTGAVNTPASGGSGATATATLPANAGGSLFTNITRSGSFFSLRCLPSDITFGVSTSNVGVVEVDFYYRMEDITTQPVTISTWKNAGKMASDKNGNYTITISTLSTLSTDLRTSPKAWFDFQYIGIGKDASAAGRSGIISQQVFYQKDCP